MLPPSRSTRRSLPVAQPADDDDDADFDLRPVASDEEKENVVVKTQKKKRKQQPKGNVGEVKPSKRRSKAAETPAEEEDELVVADSEYEDGEEEIENEVGGEDVEMVMDNPVDEDEARLVEKMAEEMKVDKAEASRRHYFPKLRLYGKGDRGTVDMPDPYDPQSFRAMEAGSQDATLIAAPKAWKPAKRQAYMEDCGAGTLRRLVQVLRKEQVQLNHEETDFKFLTRAAKAAYKEMDVEQEAAEIVASMKLNTVVGIGGSEKFSLEDLEWMGGFTAEDLRSWCIYLVVIVTKDGKVKLYVGSSTSKNGSGFRVLRTYEYWLRFVQEQGVISRQHCVRGAGAVFHAAREDVAQIHIRPLAVVPIPEDEALKSKVAAKVHRWEGVFMDLFQTVTAHNATVTIAGFAIEPLSMYTFSSRVASDWDTSGHDGLNVAHPFSQGLRFSAPLDSLLWHSRKHFQWAKAQDFMCPCCDHSLRDPERWGWKKKPGGSEGLSGYKCCQNPFRTKVTWLPQHLLCFKCYQTVMKRPNLEPTAEPPVFAELHAMTGVEDLRGWMAEKTAKKNQNGVAGNTVYPRSFVVENCPMSGTPMDVARPGESMIAARHRIMAEGRTPRMRTPAGKFGDVFPCVKDLDLCQPCYSALSSMAQGKTGPRQRKMRAFRARPNCSCAELYQITQS